MNDFLKSLLEKAKQADTAKLQAQKKAKDVIGELLKAVQKKAPSQSPQPIQQRPSTTPLMQTVNKGVQVAQGAVKQVYNTPVPALSTLMPSNPLANLIPKNLQPKVTPLQMGNLAKSFVVEPPARVGGAIALTALGKDQTTATTNTGKFLFGDQPVKSFPKQREDTSKFLQGYGVSRDQADTSAAVMVAGLAAMDVMPLAGAKTKGVSKVDDAVKLLRNKLRPEDVNMIGKFAELVETGKDKGDLGEIGKQVQSLATNVFGDEARTWSNRKVKNVFDLVLGKIGQKSNRAGLGLSIDDLRANVKSLTPEVGEKLDALSPIRQEMKTGNYTNIRAVDDRLAKTAEDTSQNFQLEDINIPHSHKPFTSPRGEGNIVTQSEPLPWETGGQIAKQTEKTLVNPAIEGKHFVDEMLNESRRVKDPGKVTQPIEEIVNNNFNDVRKKVNALDYLRTPNRVLEKIGLGDEAKMLRKQYDTYLQELPKEIDRITEWSKRVSPAANQRIFNYLDGKLSNLDNPEELKVATEIKDYLKGWATKLKLPEDRQISNYISHLFPKGAIEKEFDPEIAKLIRGKVVGSVYDPFLQQRRGMPEYLTDTWRALDAYTKRAVRKFHMDPALERISQKAEGLPEESYDYVKGHIARINMQPTKIDNLIDNTIKASPIGYRLGGRPVTAVTQKARQAVFRGLLGLNPGSALRNLQQSTNTYSMIGERDFGVGLMKTLQNMPRYLSGADTELEKVGVLGKDLIQDRSINPVHKFWEKTDSALFYMFNQAEKFNRSVAYFGAKSKAIRKGMSEEKAIDYAKDIVDKTQFNYDVISTPAALSSDLAKTLAQFAKYPAAQSEFLAEMLKRKDIAGSIRWLASNLLFIATAGQLLGLKPQDMLPQFRFGTPPTLQLPQGVAETALGTPDKYGNPPKENIIDRTLSNQNIIKGALNYLPAGGQIRKTAEGVKAYMQGASKTPSGKTRFEIPQNPINAAKSALFGQYSIDEAQDYIDNMGKSKSQVLYKELKSLPKDVANNKLMELQKSNPAMITQLKRIAKDEKLKTTDKEKQTRELTVYDGSRARAVADELRKLKTKEEKNKKLAELQLKGVVTDDVISQLSQMKKSGQL